MSATINIIEHGLPNDWNQHITYDGEVGFVDPGTLALHIPQPDGGMVIRANWKTKKSPGKGKHFDNLAEDMEQYELGKIAETLLTGIESDDASRAEWLESIARAIDVLGLRVDSPQGDDGASTAPLEGMSNIRHPLLLEAVVKYQAEFMAELLPADGPVKIRNDGTTAEQDDVAQALEQDFNHYLTASAPEYYPDTARMAFRQGLVGCAFKKVYNCELRKRPVSETVMAEDLIVSNDATDLRNAQMNGGRVTHQIRMRTMQVKRMQKAGVYRDVQLTEPSSQIDTVREAIADQQGMRAASELPEDRPHLIYECYTELELDDGIYAPYVVTMDRDSRVILAIRRNWLEDDETHEPRGIFVLYPYLLALGFYPVGLMHILSNTTMTLTATWREFVDAGMFGNFPGFLYAESVGRQKTNVIRVPPGAGQAIQTNGQPIQSAVMPLPYKSPDASFIQFMDSVAQQGRNLAGMAQIATNEGRADVPVGTMLAMIEQQLKPVQGVFRMLHRAQGEEFTLLRDRFRENPTAFWRYGTKSKRKWTEAEFIQALTDHDLVPAADPNTMSQVARVMKAGALFELAKAAPMLFKTRDVAAKLMNMANITGGEELLLSPEEIAKQGQGGDPKIMANIASKAADLQTKRELAAASAVSADKERQFRAAERALESHDRAADRESRENVAQKREDVERIKLLHGMIDRVMSHEVNQDTAETDRLFEVMKSMLAHQQKIGSEASGQAHNMDQAASQQEHDMAQTAMEHEHALRLAAMQHEHETTIAGMGPAKDKKK